MSTISAWTCIFSSNSTNVKIDLKHFTWRNRDYSWPTFLYYVISSLYVTTRNNISAKTLNMISFYSHDIVMRCTWCNYAMYVIKFVIDVCENSGFLGSKYYGFIHQWNRYKNIVEFCYFYRVHWFLEQGWCYRHFLTEHVLRSSHNWQNLCCYRLLLTDFDGSVVIYNKSLNLECLETWQFSV